MANQLSWSNLDTTYTAIAPTYIKQKIQDITFDGHLFLKKIQANGGVKKVKQSGKKIVLRLAINRNSTNHWGSSKTPEVPQVQETMTQAQFPWAFYGFNVAFFDEDLHDNMGEGQLVDLVKTAIDQALNTMQDDFSVQIGGGTSILGDGQPLQSITHGIADATYLNPGDYGGLSASTYAGWAAQVRASNGLAKLVSDLGQSYNDATFGSIKPDLIMTDQTGFQLYEDSMAGDIRYSDLQVGDASFKTLDFRGTPLYFDRDILPITATPTGWTQGTGPDAASTHRFYLLNTDEWIWVFDPEWNFDSPMSDWRTPTLERSRVKIGSVRSQLICTQRRYQALRAGVPES